MGFLRPRSPKPYERKVESILAFRSAVATLSLKRPEAGVPLWGFGPAVYGGDV